MRCGSWLVDAVAGLTAGMPEQETTQIGPSISSAHRAQVQSVIAAAVRDGARILAEGTVAQDMDSPSRGRILLLDVF